MGSFNIKWKIKQGINTCDSIDDIINKIINVLKEDYSNIETVIDGDLKNKLKRFQDVFKLPAFTLEEMESSEEHLFREGNAYANRRCVEEFNSNCSARNIRVK